MASELGSPLPRKAPPAANQMEKASVTVAISDGRTNAGFQDDSKINMAVTIIEKLADWLDERQKDATQTDPSSLLRNEELVFRHRLLFRTTISENLDVPDIMTESEGAKFLSRIGFKHNYLRHVNGREYRDRDAKLIAIGTSPSTPGIGGWIHFLRADQKIRKSNGYGNEDIDAIVQKGIAATVYPKPCKPPRTYQFPRYIRTALEFQNIRAREDKKEKFASEIVIKGFESRDVAYATQSHTKSHNVTHQANKGRTQPVPNILPTTAEGEPLPWVEQMVSYGWPNPNTLPAMTHQIISLDPMLAGAQYPLADRLQGMRSSTDTYQTGLQGTAGVGFGYGVFYPYSQMPDGTFSDNQSTAYPPQYLQASGFGSYDPQYMQEYVVPQYAMPQYEMPQYEMPQYEMPQYEMPQYEMPQYEMPQYEMPQYEMPQYEMPQYEMPQYAYNAAPGDVAAEEAKPKKRGIFMQKKNQTSVATLDPALERNAELRAGWEAPRRSRW